MTSNKSHVHIDTSPRHYTYHGIFSEINKHVASNIIKSYWKHYRYHPSNKLCYKIEMRKIDELANEFGYPNTHNPCFKKIRLHYRRIEFQKDLELTKQILSIK